MGVTKETISAGDGTNFPKKGDTVTMHYVGTLENGNKYVILIILYLPIRNIAWRS